MEALQADIVARCKASFEYFVNEMVIPQGIIDKDKFSNDFTDQVVPAIMSRTTTTGHREIRYPLRQRNATTMIVLECVYNLLFKSDNSDVIVSIYELFNDNVEKQVVDTLRQLPSWLIVPFGRPDSLGKFKIRTSVTLNENVDDSILNADIIAGERLGFATREITNETNKSKISFIYVPKYDPKHPSTEDTERYYRFMRYATEYNNVYVDGIFRHTPTGLKILLSTQGNLYITHNVEFNHDPYAKLNTRSRECMEYLRTWQREKNINVIFDSGIY